MRNKKPRIGVAIGEYVLDLAVLAKKGFFQDYEINQERIFRRKSLNRLISKGRPFITKVRNRVSEILQSENEELRDNPNLRGTVLKPMKDVEMMLPFRVGDYTDFYSSMEHATNVGSMFRDPDNALLPNWKHLPVAYHGRASSIRTHGTSVKRPKGQRKLADQASPVFGESTKLDFELEVAFVSASKTHLGTSIHVDNAESHIAGLVLFNDWSARDLQAWEYVPLGPFLGKNFISTISPWMITLDALEPFRKEAPKQSPEVLPYLKETDRKTFDINLEVHLTTTSGSSTRICETNYSYLYWTMAQQLAHHTVNGCNINPGDLFASGTISGNSKTSYGSMLELSWNGKESVKLEGGQERTFLQDGDQITLRGYCQNDSTRIGFGELSNDITPAE